MKFVSKTSSPSPWRTMISSISSIVEEANFEATADGLSFRAMDPSHIALIDVFWPNTAFEKYECNEQIKFAVRVEDLNKLIRRANQKDSVEFSLGDDELLQIKFEGTYSREFNLHLIESTSGSTPLPKLNLDSKIILKGSIFQQLLSDISTVSDHVILSSTTDSITFSGKSDTGKASAILDKGNEDLLELNVTEASNSMYSIDYLNNITKASINADDSVSLDYSSKMPMKLELKLGDKGGLICFYLAPRIEEV